MSGFYWFLGKIFKKKIDKKIEEIGRGINNLTESIHPSKSTEMNLTKVREIQIKILSLNFKSLGIKFLKQAPYVFVLILGVFPFLNIYYREAKPFQDVIVLKSIPWIGGFGWLGTYVVLSLLVMILPEIYKWMGGKLKCRK